MLYFLSGCTILPFTSRNPTELSDISYDKNSSYGYTVYIDEKDSNIPYLVLSNSYDGNCLLLREHLMDEGCIFNLFDGSGSFYSGTYIDEYLNNEYLSLLPDKLQSLICDSNVEITAKESIGNNGRDITTISRKAFILSYTEVGMIYSRTNLTEGVAISYFDSKERRIAYRANGEPGSWWLRTPNTAQLTVVNAVTKDGNVGLGGIYSISSDGYYYNGLRPAFCLPCDTKIDNIDGKYYIVL